MIAEGNRKHEGTKAGMSLVSMKNIKKACVAEVN